MTKPVCALHIRLVGNILSVFFCGVHGASAWASEKTSIDDPRYDIRASIDSKTVTNAPTTHGLTQSRRLASSSRQQREMPSNPVVTENTQTGTRDWTLSGGGTHFTDDDFSQGKPRPIQGYSSLTSVNIGEAIDFKISVVPAQEYSMQIYRMGYYQDTGGRLMMTVDSLSGTEQSSCPMDASTGLVECDWTTSYTLRVPETWTSGIYLAKLITADKSASHIVFAVRDDARNARYLYQQPISTYQAYNRFPANSGQNEGTGRSLYDSPWSAKGTHLSFDRPYAANGGISELVYGELNLVKWLEQQGYDITYATDIDTHAMGGSFLRKHRAFISAGHNEYWTKEMRDAVENAREFGTNLVFMGANVSYWQIRLEASSSGAVNRRIVAYKDATLDPVADPKTDLFRSPAVSRPEQTLVGVQYGTWNTIDNNTDYMVKNSQSWVYEGTGLKDGDKIKDLVGDEVDRVDALYPQAQNVEFTMLSDSYFRGADMGGVDETQNTVIFRTPKGGWVFSTGDMAWSWALNYDSEALGWPEVVSPAVQRTTANVLGCFGFDELCPKPLTVSVTGVGTVKSTPAGVDCGNKCVNSFTRGAIVTLAASPVGASYFGGWGGACAHAGFNRICRVTLNAARAVTAKFRNSWIRGPFIRALTGSAAKAASARK